MDDQEESSHLPRSISPIAPFWNWTRILEHDRNIIKEHMDDDDNEEDMTYVWIVGLWILVSLFIWIHHKYSKHKMCCSRKIIAEESEPPIFILHDLESSGSVSGVSGMAAVLSSMKRKDTPPPPYEDPPSYEVAIQLEKE